MTGKQLGRIIQKSREGSGLSRAEVAKWASVARSTVWRLETQGQCTLEHYLAISQVVFGASVI